MPTASCGFACHGPIPSDLRLYGLQGIVVCVISERVEHSEHFEHSTNVKGRKCFLWALVAKKSVAKDDAPKAEKPKDERAQLHARIPQLVFDRTTAMAALYGITRDEFVGECLDKATARLKALQDELRNERLEKPVPTDGS
jgi:hypothetical protein